MECNIGECYKLHVTDLAKVYGYPEQEGNQIKSPKQRNNQLTIQPLTGMPVATIARLCTTVHN